MRPGFIDDAKAWARRIKWDVVALWFAARDVRTPLRAKIVAACVAAYALSPIDLIPDFIPVLGYLLIVPLGIMLAVRLIPPVLMVEFRHRAEEAARRPTSAAGAIVIFAVWVIVAAGVILMLWWR